MYLRELINYYKNKGEWKVQLIAEINFMSLKPGSDETPIMHTRSDNIEITIGDDNLSDCNWTRTHNHLVHKRTLNHLAKLAK